VTRWKVIRVIEVIKVTAAGSVTLSCRSTVPKLDKVTPSSIGTDHPCHLNHLNHSNHQFEAMG